MKYHQTFLIISIILSTLIFISGGVGVTATGVYEREAFDWQVQAVWQDYVDVFLIIPVLLISGIFAYYKRRIAELVWAGTLLYLAYTYLIFCFDIHFNQLFIFYCFILGGSFYALTWFVYYKIAHRPFKDIIPVRSIITATYLIVTGTTFYILWLADVTPAMLTNTTPVKLEQYELPTNPVHVIDLSLLLPAYMLTGIMMYLRIGSWQLLMPLLLVFGVLMSVTIAGLQVLLFVRHLDGNLWVAIGLFSVALFNIVLLYNNLHQRTHRVSARTEPV